MAGLARVAWFIMAEVGAVMACALAQAASPRDAVRMMPTLLHRSVFNTDESNQPGAQKNRDSYDDFWDIYWNPPPIQLAESASGTMAVEYHLNSHDLIDRLGGAPNDYRNDKLTVLLSAKAQDSLSADYRLDESDLYSIGSPRWVSTRSDHSEMVWTPLGVPARMVVSYNRNNSFSPGSAAGADELLSASAEYNPPMGAFGQSYSVRTEDYRSRNYATGTGTNQQFLVMTAQRQLPLGPLGAPWLAYQYDETTREELGSPVTTRHSTYTLNWDGNVSNTPLRYHFGYFYYNEAIAAATATTNTTQVRNVQLIFEPPAPPGKSTSATLTDEQSVTTASPGLLPVTPSKDHQTVQWSFQANPRVGGALTYDATNTTDIVAKTHIGDDWSLTGTASYQIPGSRGSYNLYLNQGSTRNPSNGSSSTSNSATLTSSFNLGPRANMILTLNQHADRVPSDRFNPWSSDTFFSQVNYYLRPAGVPLGLNAVWSQNYIRTASDSPARLSATTTQTYNITLDYQTPANWHYTLQLGALDVSDNSGGTPSYYSDNNVLVTISYQF